MRSSRRASESACFHDELRLRIGVAHAVVPELHGERSLELRVASGEVGVGSEPITERELSSKFLAGDRRQVQVVWRVVGKSLEGISAFNTQTALVLVADRHQPRFRFRDVGPRDDDDKIDDRLCS